MRRRRRRKIEKKGSQLIVPSIWHGEEVKIIKRVNSVLTLFNFNFFRLADHRNFFFCFNWHLSLAALYKRRKKSSFYRWLEPFYFENPFPYRHPFLYFILLSRSQLNWQFIYFSSLWRHPARNITLNIILFSFWVHYQKTQNKKAQRKTTTHHWDKETEREIIRVMILTHYTSWTFIKNGSTHSFECA